MNIAELVVVFVIVWWLVFFMALPIGVVRDKEVSEGNELGAPRAPRLALKALGTSLVAACITGGIYWALSSGQFTLRGTFGS